MRTDLQGPAQAPFRPIAGADHVFRVLTYNVHGWVGLDEERRWDRVGDVIAETGAGVIGLNEVHQPHPSQTRRPGPLDELCRRLDCQHVFAPTLESTPWPEWSNMAYGNALLSRHPITHHANLSLPALPDVEPRGLLETVVALPGIDLTVYVTHLHAPATEPAENLRREQVEAILDVVERGSATHLIVGDFNSVVPAERRPHEVAGALQPILDAGYVDAFKAVGEGEGLTFSTDDARWRIDYVFVAPALADRLVACRRIDNPTVRVASDHFPVMATFQLT